MKKILLLIFSLISFAAYSLSSQHAMVVSEQALASDAGNEILQKGGNAIDAAVAVGYALAVVSPCCGNIGGGGFMTIHLSNGKNTFINFRERAPLKATRDMYLDKNKQLVPALSTDGYLAVAVPGTVLGFETVLKKYGKLSRQQVMAPAIRLAEKGFVLSPGDMNAYLGNISYFKKTANVAKIFLNDNKPFKVGDKFIQTDLANTLKLISSQGAKVFYLGSIAQQVVAASNQQGGILTLADFANYKVEELSPITCTYHDVEIISAPPPSSGGITLCEMTNILEGYPLNAFGFHSQKAVHYMVEAMRFSFADRNANLGDPDFIHNPYQELLSKNYAAKIRAQIDSEKPSAIHFTHASHEGMQTTHYSIVDKWGNAVSATVTLNSFYGAKVIAGNTGFFLNDEMDDFETKLGSPNQFGLVQGEKNAIAPGKRPLSSMTPSIILKNNHVLMVIGSPGGPRIITAVLQGLVNVLDFHMSIQDAVTAKRFHHQWLPDEIFVEPGAIPLDVQTNMEKLGYHFKTENPWGAVEAIYIDPKTHLLYGGTDDRRKGGKEVGY